MFMTKARRGDISNAAKTIDSSDIERRIEELNELRDEGEIDSDDLAELVALEKVASVGRDYCDDWEYGATLIRDSYFTDYAMDFLEECGDIPQNLPSYIVIDREATAEAIQQDYTAIDYDGVTYWVR